MSKFNSFMVWFSIWKVKILTALFALLGIILGIWTIILGIVPAGVISIITGLGFSYFTYQDIKKYFKK